jgi:hypothetical protein
MSTEQHANYYEVDGELYAIQFPRQWALNHLDYTGPKNCMNCKYYGSWNGVFIGYCTNCAREYDTDRGNGFSDIGEEKPTDEFIRDLYYENDYSAKNTYLKNVKPDDIGDKINLEDSEKLFNVTYKLSK